MILVLGMAATSGVKQKVTVHTRTYVRTYIHTQLARIYIHNAQHLHDLKLIYSWNIHCTCYENILFSCWNSYINQSFTSGIQTLLNIVKYVWYDFCFTLQITLFATVLSLDCKGIDINHLHQCKCVHSKNNEEYKEEETNKNPLFPFMKNFYAPFLMNKYIRLIVVCM